MKSLVTSINTFFMFFMGGLAIMVTCVMLMALSLGAEVEAGESFATRMSTSCAKAGLPATCSLDQLYARQLAAK